MKMKKVIALFLACAMTVGNLSALTFAEEETEAAETEAAAEAAEETADGSTPLVVSSQAFSAKFSPFFAESAPDQEICKQVNVFLVDNTRAGAVIYNGIEGETENYNGTDYTYQSIADISVTENEDTTVYDFKLRDDVKFSDGTPLTADDVIFSLYVYADMDYDGFETLYSSNIKGLQNYRMNSTAADSVSEEDVAALKENLPEELLEKVKTDLMRPLLESEYDWAEGAWEEYADAYGVTNGAEFYALLYSTDENYSAEGKDKDTIINEIADMYGSDYAALAANYGDDALFNEDIDTMVREYLVDQKMASGEGEEVPNIEGIKKINDHEVEVTTDGFDVTTIYTLGILVAPLHYYGDVSLYDYDNNQFGFTRGDLSAVREKTSQPMGAGAYKFVKYENKTVYMEANENYWKGEPKIKYMQYREAADADFIPGVAQGTVDVANPSGTKERFAQIEDLNGDGQLSGSVITTSLVDNLGYGYIGLCADNVKVGDDPASEASRDLRKAFATVFAAYRDVSIDSYYGDAAAVINYPISNTSWAAPQKSDEDYEVAYSKDAEGNAIYTEDMTDEEKFAAAEQAALGYFEAAGYTVENGKITAAPEGAKMSYEVVIPADGTGDHPSFAILTDAKEALGNIGMELSINDLSAADSSTLWDGLDAGTIEMWAAAWQQTLDPDLYQIYHSASVASNHYHIKDATLDQDIIDARGTSDQSYRKSVYHECFGIILDWAVEVPVYQRQNCIIFSSERVNVDTITPDITSYYNWYAEINNMEMK